MDIRRNLASTCLLCALATKFGHIAPTWAAQGAQNKGAAETESLTNSQRERAITELRESNLIFPIKGFNVERVKNSFNETRGKQRHEASDILAPRNTPVLAVENGSIAKLFLSKLGGITVYQYDPAKKFIYYYAHLERYAKDLKEGDFVHQGQLLGYVGTSGDAPKDTPHLHFSISVLGAKKEWWHTSPIDPYLVFKR